MTDRFAGRTSGDTPEGAAQLPVAVDAMGGDRAPEEIVAGARQAADAGLRVVLVGDPRAIGDTCGLELIAAAETIGMEEDPARAVRTKKDSSLVRAAEAVRDGRACAMFSAGNTGATMASALLRMGRIRGLARPAIATVIPVPGGGATVLLDSGANADCSAAWLVQFARMGAAFARHRLGLEAPRVGLLSIGEEPGKGSALVKEAFGLLQSGAGGPGVQFLGNVEGRDVMSDSVDVVVTDGFTGNVVLKALEGSLKRVFKSILCAMSSTPETQRAGDELMPALLRLVDQLDPDAHGGAMLLGVDGVCVIGHGSSSARAVHNAIRVASAAVNDRLVGSLGASLAPV